MDCIGNELEGQCNSIILQPLVEHQTENGADHISHFPAYQFQLEDWYFFRNMGSSASVHRVISGAFSYGSRSFVHLSLLHSRYSTYAKRRMVLYLNWISQLQLFTANS